MLQKLHVSQSSLSKQRIMKLEKELELTVWDAANVFLCVLTEGGFTKKRKEFPTVCRSLKQLLPFWDIEATLHIELFLFFLWCTVFFCDTVFVDTQNFLFMKEVNEELLSGAEKTFNLIFVLKTH